MSPQSRIRDVRDSRDRVITSRWGADAQEGHSANGASLREPEQPGAPGTVDVRDLLTEEELECSRIYRVGRRPEYPVQYDGRRRRHSLCNDRVEGAGATDAVQPHLSPAAVIDLGERARRRDDAARDAAAVGTDRQEETAKRVMDTGCAFCEPGGCPHQRPGICSMSYQLVECRYDPYGCLGLGVYA